MNTQQAAKMAFDLDKRGVSRKEISKMLAKDGYLSFKTGKALSTGGVAIMIAKMKSGKPIQIREMRKHASAVHRSTAWRRNKQAQRDRAKQPMVVSPSTAPAAPTKFIGMPTVNVATNQKVTRWDIAKLIDMSDDFVPTTKRALLELIVDASLK